MDPGSFRRIEWDIGSQYFVLLDYNRTVSQTKDLLRVGRKSKLTPNLHQQTRHDSFYCPSGNGQLSLVDQATQNLGWEVS